MIKLLDADQWIECLDALRSNGLRTTLTAFGVFWGIFMLVVMLGFTNGLAGAMRDEFGSLTQNAIFVRSTPTTRAHAGFSPGRTVELSLADLKVLAALPGVRAVGGRLETELMVARGARSKLTPVIGTTAAEDVERDTIVSGRGLTRRDSILHRKVAVIGHEAAKSLFGANVNPIGQDIRIGSINVLVVGVAQSAGNDAASRAKNARVVMPYTTLSKLNPRLPLAALIVVMRDDALAATVIGQTQEQLRRWHSISPTDPGGIIVVDRAKRYREVQSIIRAMTLFAWLIGGLTLLTGAFGVSNITLVSIAQRTREFGVRRAVGASALDLATQVALEALVLCGATGYLGFVLALALLNTSRDLLSRADVVRKLEYLIAPQIDLSTAALAVFALVLAGALACIAPVRRAIAMRPTECLADE